MKKRYKKIYPRLETISSEPGSHPDATIGPDASVESTLAIWKDKESTNAPPVGEEEPDSQPASGYPALIEKLLHNKIPLKGRTVVLIAILVWFIFVSWLFIQDNEAGKLIDCKGLWWFCIKTSLYTALLFVASALIGLTSLITNRFKKAS